MTVYFVGNHLYLILLRRNQRIKCAVLKAVCLCLQQFCRNHIAIGGIQRHHHIDYDSQPRTERSREFKVNNFSV